MRKWIGIALVVALACVSAAQGGGGGRQGRGGMMMMRGGGGGSGMQLALRDDVSKELNLTADQRTKLRDMADAQRDEMRSMFQSMAGSGEQPDRSAMEKMMQEMQAKQKKQMAEILTAEQIKRLGELRIQRAGNSAIMDPEVQTALGLTTAQKDKINDLMTKQGEAMQAVMEKVRNQEMDRSELRPLMEKNRKIMDQELGKVLTAEQTKKLADMGGKPFTFDPSEDNQRGPGGR